MSCVNRTFCGRISLRLFHCDSLDGLSEIIQSAFYPGTIYLLSRLVALIF